MVEVDQQPKVATIKDKKKEIKQKSLLQETLTRLFRYRLSIVSLVILVILVLAAIFAPLIAPYDRFKMDFSVRLQGPIVGHWLGTDESGRDLLSRIIWGGRITLGVAILAVIIASGVGIPWGMIAAQKGGAIDDLLMRICDILMAFPSLVLALLIVTAMGPGFWNIVLTIGILQAPHYARVARGAALGENGREYVLASTALGGNSYWIITRHIIPNCIPALAVQTSLAAASVILTEAALSFLGLGIQPPEASWATMLRQGYSYLNFNAWYAFFPGMVIFLTVWALNALGDGLRDALDPRMRGHEMK
jgi:peptide/nickel transport system permease protein